MRVSQAVQHEILTGLNALFHLRDVALYTAGKH